MCKQVGKIHTEYSARSTSVNRWRQRIFHFSFVLTVCSQLELTSSLFPDDAMSSDTQASLRIVSYNILADCYVRVPEQPWNAFSYCSDEHLSFAERAPRIVESLIQSNGDIILLQEVMFELRDELWQLPEYLVVALQEKGYVAVMQGLKQKDIAKNAIRNERMVGKAIPTGLAIFWKNDKFTEFDVSKSGSGSGMTVYLQFLESKSLLSINNIHLVGDPSKFDQHLKQLEGAQKQLDNKKVFDAVNSGFVKCVYEFICGDFNGDVTIPNTNADEPSEMRVGSDSVRTVVGKWFDTNHYQRAPTGTSWASDSLTSTLDHVMFRCQVQGQKELQEQDDCSAPLIVCSHCVPDLSEEKDEFLLGGLPNQFHPSDHVMLLVDFCI